MPGLDRVRLWDLERYMGILGARRADRWASRGGSVSARMGLQHCRLRRPAWKGFYLHQAALGVNPELGKSLNQTRLRSRLDWRRSFLGHTTTSLPANPLAPQGP